MLHHFKQTLGASNGRHDMASYGRWEKTAIFVCVDDIESTGKGRSSCHLEELAYSTMWAKLAVNPQTASLRVFVAGILFKPIVSGPRSLATPSYARRC